MVSARPSRERPERNDDDCEDREPMTAEEREVDTS